MLCRLWSLLDFMTNVSIDISKTPLNCRRDYSVVEQQQRSITARSPENPATYVEMLESALSSIADLFTAIMSQGLTSKLYQTLNNMLELIDIFPLRSSVENPLTEVRDLRSEFLKNSHRLYYTMFSVYFTIFSLLLCYYEQCLALVHFEDRCRSVLYCISVSSELVFCSLWKVNSTP